MPRQMMNARVQRVRMRYKPALYSHPFTLAQHAPLLLLCTSKQPLPHSTVLCTAQQESLLTVKQISLAAVQLLLLMKSFTIAKMHPCWCEKATGA